MEMSAEMSYTQLKAANDAREAVSVIYMNTARGSLTCITKYLSFESGRASNGAKKEEYFGAYLTSPQRRRVSSRLCTFTSC